MRVEIPRFLSNPLARTALALSVLTTPACAKAEVPVPTPTILPSQTPRPIEAVKQAAAPSSDKPLTIDEEAREYAIRTWLGFLNLQTSYRNRPDIIDVPYRLSLDTKYEYSKWDTNMGKIVRTNTQPIEGPFIIKLNADQIPSKINQSSIAWRKYGEVQIDHISVKDSQKRILSDAQKANGLAWEGFVKLKFVTRYRVVTEIIDTPINTEIAETWVKNPQKNNLPNFSDWDDDKWEVHAEKKQGNWRPDYMTGIGAPLVKVPTTSDYMTFIITGSVCEYTSGAPCYNVRVKP